MANIKEIKSLEEYNEFINNPNSLNIVKMGAAWCGPCRALEQTIRELTSGEVEGIMLAEIDVDDEWFEDKLDELKIRGIPVLFAYKNGEEVDRVQGNQPKADLINFFERNK